ncbi:hypothetical protein LC612_36690 [Nostoc sp. CHAB 5834]|nr:hypothetical protein [Nostoc sp. CHAB 5834]
MTQTVRRTVFVRMDIIAPVDSNPALAPDDVALWLDASLTQHGVSVTSTVFENAQALAQQELALQQ